MKTAIRNMGFTVLAIWAAGLTLYFAKNVPVLGDVARKATEGFGQ